MPTEPEPVFRVVRGVPTVEELAALVGAVLLRRRPDAAMPRPNASAWTRSARPGAISPGGAPSRPGPDAWRLSGLPL